MNVSGHPSVDLPEPSVNLSTVFAGQPIPEGVAAAAAAGFSAVEFWWPVPALHEPLAAAVAEAGVKVEMFTTDSGDTERGARGLLADPNLEHRFRRSCEQALALAERLRCTRLYTLIGNRRDGLDPALQRETVRQRLAAMADAAAERGIEILIEPVNSVDNGPQVVGGFDDGAALLDELRRDNLGLLFDVYHARHAEPDVVAALTRVRNRVGHIHISDFPGRVEPGRGELDFEALAAALRADGYAGTLGFEWFPLGPVAEGLDVATAFASAARETA